MKLKFSKKQEPENYEVHNQTDVYSIFLSD